MSNDDEYDGNESEGVKSLRKALEKAQAEKDALAKQISDLAAKDRTRTIADKFTEFKINPKIAKMVPADIEVEKIDEWIGENADWLGVSLNAEPEANEQEAASQKRISGFSSEQSALDQTPELTALQAVTTKEQLDELLYRSLAGNGPR